MATHSDDPITTLVPDPLGPLAQISKLPPGDPSKFEWINDKREPRPVSRLASIHVDYRTGECTEIYVEE